MNVFYEKTQKNKLNAIVPKVGQQKGSGKGCFQLQDNRPAVTVPVIQRYLIIGNTDYTRRARPAPQGDGHDIDATTAAVQLAMLAALDQTNNYQNQVHQFIQADAGGLVTRQIKKWIEDDQGRPRFDGKGLPAFGRKQQGRSYSNMVDAAKAIYGWVSSKPARHQEKVMANQVLQNPVIDEHLNSLLSKIREWIRGKPNSAAIEGELDQAHQLGEHWDDYRSYFNHNPAGLALALQVPTRFLPVLDNPQVHTMRDKVAVLHDVMKYFMDNSHKAGEGLLAEENMPTFKATVRTGFFSRELSEYNRPQGSHIPRNALAHNLVNNNLANERANDRLKDSQEETHASYKFARQNQIPMWARHSYTAARMMHLAKQAGADKGELSAVAWSTMAFWRMHYDHRQIPYHTLHEIMDFTPAFGLKYNPLDREAGLRHQNIQQQLIDSILGSTKLSGWNERTQTIFKSRPTGVTAIQGEAKSKHTNNRKLSNIRVIANARIGAAPGRHADTRHYYQILDGIPPFVNLYEQPGTSVATNGAIKTQLLHVFRQIKQFHLP